MTNTTSKPQLYAFGGKHSHFPFHAKINNIYNKEQKNSDLQIKTNAILTVSRLWTTL